MPKDCFPMLLRVCICPVEGLGMHLGSRSHMHLQCVLCHSVGVLHMLSLIFDNHKGKPSMVAELPMACLDVTNADVHVKIRS